MLRTMAHYLKTYSEDGILICNVHNSHIASRYKDKHTIMSSQWRDVRQFTLGHLKEERSPGEGTWGKQEKEAWRS